MDYLRMHIQYNDKCCGKIPSTVVEHNIDPGYYYDCEDFYGLVDQCDVCKKIYYYWVYINDWGICGEIVTNEYDSLAGLYSDIKEKCDTANEEICGYIWNNR